MTEIRLYAERRLGEMLAETVRAGNPQLSSSTTIGLPNGITRDQSSKWQRIARLPDDVFQHELAKPEPTTARLVKVARQRARLHHQADVGLPAEAPVR